MSQTDLGNLVGVKKATISNWELGMTSPTIPQLIQMSKIFKLSLEDLLTKDLEHEPAGEYREPHLDYLRSQEEEVFKVEDSSLEPIAKFGDYLIGRKTTVDQVNKASNSNDLYVVQDRLNSKQYIGHLQVQSDLIVVVPPSRLHQVHVMPLEDLQELFFCRFKVTSI